MEFLRGLFKEKNTQNCRSFRYLDSDSGDQDYHKFGLQKSPAGSGAQETDSSWNCRQPNCLIHPLEKRETNAASGPEQEKRDLPTIVVVYKPEKKEVTLEDYEWSDKLMDVTLNNDKSLDEPFLTQDDDELSEVLGITEMDKSKPISSVVNPSVEVLSGPTSLQTTIRHMDLANNMSHKSQQTSVTTIRQTMSHNDMTHKSQQTSKTTIRQTMSMDDMKQNNQPISKTDIKLVRSVKYLINKSQQTNRTDFKGRTPEKFQIDKNQQIIDINPVKRTPVVKNVTNKNCRRKNMARSGQKIPVKNVMQKSEFKG